MACCLAILAALSPRLVLFIMWLFNTPAKLRVLLHSNPVLGILGFLFLPFTSLVYVLAYNPISGKVSGFGILMLIFAFLVDLSAYAGGYKTKGGMGGSGGSKPSTAQKTDVIDAEEE